MEEYKRLQNKLSEELYSELALFWVNNLDLLDNQANDLATLIEKIANSKTCGCVDCNCKDFPVECDCGNSGGVCGC